MGRTVCGERCAELDGYRLPTGLEIQQDITVVQGLFPEDENKDYSVIWNNKEPGGMWFDPVAFGYMKYSDETDYRINAGFRAYCACILSVD